jgi:putative methionine-R-sulfoxide reductase with GAF domain
MGSAQGQVPSEVEQARTAPEFGPHTPLSERLLAVAIRAQNFTGSTGVAIALAEGDQMVCRANWGTSAPEVGATLSRENSFTGLCVRTGEPLRCDDAKSDPRVDPEACQALEISAIAAAPVHRGLKVIGVIAAFSDTSNAFTDKHLLILTMLADVVVELLDDPHPVQPLPRAVEAPAPDLARAAGIVQASVAPLVDKASLTITTMLQEPAALTPTPTPTPVPDFVADRRLSGVEADAGSDRRWLLPVAILVIFAILAFAVERRHVAMSASKAQPVPTAQAPAPQAAPAAPSELTPQEKPPEPTLAEPK